MAKALSARSSSSRHSRTTESMSLARSYASNACSHLGKTKKERNKAGAASEKRVLSRGNTQLVVRSCRDVGRSYPGFRLHCAPYSTLKVNYGCGSIPQSLATYGYLDFRVNMPQDVTRERTAQGGVVLRLSSRYRVDVRISPSGDLAGLGVLPQ